MPALRAAPVLSGQAARLKNCPDCTADLAVLSVIPGRAGAEYWTMRCTKCGGIHLDIVAATEVTKETDDLLV